MKILDFIIISVIFYGCLNQTAEESTQKYKLLDTIPIPPPALTIRIDSINKNNAKCYYKKEFTDEMISKIYPFNESQDILLIYFPIQPDKDGFIITGSNYIPITKSKIDKSKVYNQIKLTNVQKLKLFDILFNYKYSGKIIFIEHLTCFNSENGILFVDKHDEIIEWIELDFCDYDYGISSSKLENIEFCSEKIEHLRKFFISSGMKIGDVGCDL